MLKEKRLKVDSRTLEKESTVKLVRRIVENSDRLALEVLLETRKLFRLKHTPPLLLPEFLLILRNRLAPPDNITHDKKFLFADCVYDLTMAKYSNFPDSSYSKSNSRDYSVKGTGIDCRNYYRAFLRRIQREIGKGKIKNQIEEESYTGIVLQNMVYKNFLRSKLDCQRDTPFSVRYMWTVNDVKLYLWYPSYMTAKEFRKWLEENIKEVNPKSPDEQKRIQSFIDKVFKRGYHVSTDEPDGKEPSVMEKATFSVEFYEGFIFMGNLADSVAQEKTRNIHKVRPSIKRLGEKGIERLILQIFTLLSANEYNASHVADQHGINKASLSRFAGSMWFEKTEEDDFEIPDLWKNTAKILAGNPTFMKTVINSGYAGILKKVMDMIKPKEGHDNDG